MMDQLTGLSQMEIWRALVDEMQFWNQRLDEHARLIRSGVDLTEDNIIKEADFYVTQYDQLVARLNTPGLLSNPNEIMVLVQESKQMAIGLGQFKLMVEEGIRTCRIKAILPAELLDHIRRELEYFVGKLNAVTGGPRPTWADLGLDHSDRQATIIPRMLLERIGNQIFPQIILEELLFWLHISADHAQFLAFKFKPLEQTEFTQESLKYSKEFERLLQQVMKDHKHGELVSVVRSAVDLNCDWINYLSKLNQLIATCQIPSRQTNFWPALAVHISAEQVYFQTILQIASVRLS